MAQDPRPVAGSVAVGELGQLFEAYGWPRLVGRVMAMLLLADPPYMSSAQLCDQLQVSKGHLSSAIQMLDGLGILERFGVPGSRQHHYRLTTNAFEVMLRRSAEPLRRMAEYADRALAHVPPGSRAESELTRMRDVYRLLLVRLPQLIDELPSPAVGR